MKELINNLKTNWSVPQKAHHKGIETTFLLQCQLGMPESYPVNYPFDVPDDIVKFWDISGHSKLFTDIEYGQWGLEIFPPEQASVNSNFEHSSRPRDFRSTDLVLGRFLGDSDLLVISCNKNEQGFGAVMISLPLDPRSDWPMVSSSFASFLEEYVKNEGDKFWEY